MSSQIWASDDKEKAKLSRVKFPPTTGQGVKVY